MCWLGVLAALHPGELGAEPPQYDENKVKGAFLAKFAAFVEWPVSAFPDSHAPLVIGVIGRDPFGPQYETELSQEKARGRTFLLKRMDRTAGVTNCQILFVSSSESQRLPEILAVVGTAPVLVVGDQEGFASRGGMINFFKEDGKLRFEINESAVKRNGLVIDSKLLSVARIVKPAPPRRGA